MTSWQPTASSENLRLRAQILTKIRAFFAARAGFWKLKPLSLCHATVTDLHLQSFSTAYNPGGNIAEETLYLQTSPGICNEAITSWQAVAYLSDL